MIIKLIQSSDAKSAQSLIQSVYTYWEFELNLAREAGGAGYSWRKRAVILDISDVFIASWS
jgi:hypothetical protein